MIEIAIRNARALVIDVDFHNCSCLACAQEDRAPSGRETLRVANQVAQDLYQPAFDGLDHHRAGRQIDAQMRVGLIAGGLGDIAKRAKEGRQIHWLHARAGEFGIHAARIADVADQTVQAHDIVLNDREQLQLLAGLSDTAQCVNRTAYGTQRVLDFVGDIRGKTFNGIHARP